MAANNLVGMDRSVVAAATAVVDMLHMAAFRIYDKRRRRRRCLVQVPIKYP